MSSNEFQGCIFVNASFEFPLPHEPIHVAAVAHKQAIEEAIRELVARAGADDPAGMARQLCLVMEGAYITRQLTGDLRTFDAARQIADLIIASHLPEAVGVTPSGPIHAGCGGSD
jgi:hypothetical protein